MSLSIIGCGWLGQKLALELLADNIDVVASYQSQTSKDKLSQLSIPAFELSLPIADNINTFNTVASSALFQQQTLLIAIPPQLKRGKKDYPQKIQQLVKLAEQGQVQQIILLNSTAIYNGLSGDVNENSTLDLGAEKVSTLLAAEQAALAFSKNTIILRLAGLVGEKRHPGRFLTAKRIFEQANAWVNLVHQQDVNNIIKHLMQPKHQSQNAIYNVVSAKHYTREYFYQKAAQALSLPVPQFSPKPTSYISKSDAGKKVNGDKLRATLVYNYQYDDLLAWL